MRLNAPREVTNIKAVNVGSSDAPRFSRQQRSGGFQSVDVCFPQSHLHRMLQKVNVSLRHHGREATKPAVIDQDSVIRSEEHTSELQSHLNLVCRLLLEKKKK